MTDLGHTGWMRERLAWRPGGIGGRQVPFCPGGRIHTVRPGDTLFALAQRFGVGLDAVLRANPQITNPDILRVGQQICIPAPPVPPRGRRCLTLNPTDLVPRSLGVVGLDFNLNRVVAAVDGLPAPGQINPGSDLWRAWFRLRTTDDWTFVDLGDCDGVWAGAGDILDLFLYGPVLVTAEPAGQTVRPMGPGGAEGTIPEG